MLAHPQDAVVVRVKHLADVCSIRRRGGRRARNAGVVDQEINAGGVRSLQEGGELGDAAYGGYVEGCVCDVSETAMFRKGASGCQQLFVGGFEVGDCGFAKGRGAGGQVDAVYAAGGSWSVEVFVTEDGEFMGLGVAEGEAADLVVGFSLVV